MVLGFRVQDFGSGGLGRKGLGIGIGVWGSMVAWLKAWGLEI